MEIKTAAVIGAGAIGSYFIAGLSPKLKDGLWIVAEGERKHRLSENGITVNDRKIPLHVKTPEEAKGADLVLVTVKYGALEAALPMIEKIVDSHTIVLSPMNGVDSEKVIGERIGMEHMVYSMIKIASERKEDRISYNPETTQGIFFGEKDGQESERIKALSELFSGTQVHYHVCDNIEQDIWYKYALNISKICPRRSLTAVLERITTASMWPISAKDCGRKWCRWRLRLELTSVMRTTFPGKVPLFHRRQDFLPCRIWTQSVLRKSICFPVR